MQKGYSIIEMLVVIVVFSILTLVTTQAIFLTLRGSNKSSASIRVRENVDFAISVIERQLRNAQYIDCPDSTELRFTDEYGDPMLFSCNGGDEGNIASGEARLRLTSEEVFIDCRASANVFVCSSHTPPAPDSVQINIQARDAKNAGAEGSTISVSTKILLRSYN